MTATLAAPTAAERTVAAAALLVARRVLVAVLSAVSTAVVARALGVRDFGQLSAALATYYLVTAVGDLGFSQVTVRRLAVHPDRRGAVLRSGRRVALAWSALLGAGTVGLAAQAGLGHARGRAILVLAPAVLITGLTAGRQVFLVAGAVRRMTLVDLATSLAQAAALILVARGGLGIVALAAVTASGVLVNTAICAAMAARLVDGTRPGPGELRGFLVEALPLGLASVVSSAYFSVDLVLITHLTTARPIGEYAAAVRVLSIMVAVPGIIVGAALPGLAIEVADRERLSRLVSRVWHLMASTALPGCVAVGLYAPLVISVLYGSAYAGSGPLLRVLALAAMVSLLNNILASLLLALGRGRRMLVVNLAGLVLNVGLNVLLVPRYGVAASAWATLLTEVLVAGFGLLCVGDRLRLGPSLAASARPLAAIGAGAAAGLALARWPWPAAAGGGLVFLAVLTAVRGWPAELRLPGRRGPAGASA